LRKITDYTWHTGKLKKPVQLLVVSDLHNDEYEDILPLLENADILLLPGDLTDAYRQQFDRSIMFLAEAAKILPTYVGVGNHEMRMGDFDIYSKLVLKTGAKLLFNAYERQGDLAIGCWYRPQKYGHTDILPMLEAEDGCKILMCHRPEDYIRCLRSADVDLVLAGHAHGGQIRLFGRGVYASGQGLFPKYTRGVVERMIISTGVSNRVPVPRWNNPCEIVRIELD
jgi:uncharacterized protein